MKGEDIGYGWMFTDGLYFGRMFSKELGSIYLEQSKSRIVTQKYDRGNAKIT